MVEDKGQQRKGKIGCLVFIVIIVAIILFAIISMANMSREDEAKHITIEMVEDYTGIEFEKDTSLLETKETYIQVEGTYYQVSGQLKKKIGRNDSVLVILEDLDDKWRLEALKYNGKMLYGE